MAEEFDFHPMWESLGMNLADHDMLLGAVGQMYGDMFLTQNNRPKSTSYLDFVATNIHSGRIKEMLDKKEAGEATKIVGSFCVYVPEEIVLACDGIPVGLCSGADWATDKVEEHLPRNTCPLIKSFAGFKLGEVCPYIESSDLVVGENTCDGKKKAYEFFATQKNMYVMDIPNVHDESTLVTWKAEVKKACRQDRGRVRRQDYARAPEGCHPRRQREASRPAAPRCHARCRSGAHQRSRQPADRSGRLYGRHAASDRSHQRDGRRVRAAR